VNRARKTDLGRRNAQTSRATPRGDQPLFAAEPMFAFPEDTAMPVS
jgi:hypothetical protein